MINKQLKKAIAISLVAAMSASALAGCGNTTGGSDTSTEAKTDGDQTKEDKTESPVVEAEKMDAPSTEGWDESKKIYAYSWNDEFGSRLQFVLNKYPEYEEYVEYVNLGCSGTDGTYQQKIDALLEANGDDYPSIIAMDNDVAKYYTETENALSMKEIGITDGMYANAYQYTVDYATYDGELKALTWQATPGNFTYRRSIAKDVLGSDDPADVQAAVKDWDTFFETADKMKEAGYKMLSGPDDVKYAIWDQQTQPWVSEDNKLQLDDAVTEYFETAKKLYDGDYTDKTSMWGDAWNANFEDDVFGYFGCTWFVYWCIKTDKESEKSTYGDWAVCEGPVSYHWGGTYVAVMKNCPNTELAAFLIYSLCCDEDIMYTIEAETLDFVNNKAAVERIIKDGKGKSDILGGQDPVATWAEAATKIDLSNSTYMDAALKAIMDKASEGYNNGTYATVDDAVQYVKDQVADQYEYIVVE